MTPTYIDSCNSNLRSKYCINSYGRVRAVLRVLLSLATAASNEMMLYNKTSLLVSNNASMRC